MSKAVRFDITKLDGIFTLPGTSFGAMSTVPRRIGNEDKS
jgi:hypothetical protein